MSSPPRIGITVHSADVRTPQGARETRFDVSATYAAAVAGAGGVPLLVPAHRALGVAAADVLAALDGLLVSGGGGLPADYFVANPNPSLRDTNPARYDAEADLVSGAWSRGLPLLGICRGHQTIAEALGGTLLNDLRTDPLHAEHYQTLPATEPTHALELEQHTLLAALVPAGVHVNSFHRQSVLTPPDGWLVSARSPDGIVEAIESPGAAATVTAGQGSEPVGPFAVGCQFHPEWLAELEPGFARLFDTFVAAAAGFAATRAARAVTPPATPG